MNLKPCSVSVLYSDVELEDRYVRRVTNKATGHQGYMIFCPACKCGHMFDSRWTWNQDFDKPTFKPSMLVNQSTTPETCNMNRHRCHSFVTDGMIKFLGDCTHDMKNQTVKLEGF